MNFVNIGRSYGSFVVLAIINVLKGLALNVPSNASVFILVLASRSEIHHTSTKQPLRLPLPQKWIKR